MPLAPPLAAESNERIPGSFRDPAGFVFKSGGVVYRQVNPVYRSHYDHLIASGLYANLADRGLLVPHSEVHLSRHDAAGVHRVIRPEPIPFLSYPYEWCFGQLKDAALATLEIQRAALAHGMSLKDSSAYNIQFRGCRPVLIDTLSFEICDEGRPWAGYRQFSEHFLAPLALMSKVDVRLGQLLRIHLDGVPLDLASRMLPLRTRLAPSLMFHLHLHAAAQRRFSQDVSHRGRRRISRRAMLGLVDTLMMAVEALKWEPQTTEWAGYDQHSSYSTEARRHKEELVREFLALAGARTVWDLGANSGRFSRMAAARDAYTVAFDSDYGAAEVNYRECRKAGETRVLPLVVDLANPSPALGWAQEERLGWTERAPADLILALALVHHLAIGNNVPLARAAELFRRLAARLIVEFVPKADPMARRLLAAREDVYDEYSQAGFERAFEPHFQIRRSVPVRESARVMYLMEARER